MRKFIVIVVAALVVLCGVGFYVYKINDVNETYENNEIKNNSNMLSMMLETSAGSGEYQETTASAWPTEGYVFNENLSKCEQGSSLSWDSAKNTVVMMGNNSDKCYVYFDKAPDTVKLSDYIKSLCTTQGANNLYLHDSTLENGAGDNSYRYAGSSDTTNNFVCFGYDSQDGSCPTDYLYRIIGVFDNEVKLIKYDYANVNLLGTDGDYSIGTYSKSSYSTYKGELTTINRYYWNYKATNSLVNSWSTSLLNKTNLNTNYLNNIGTNWSNKIATHTWKVGGNTYKNIYSAIVSNTYKNEIISPAEETTYDAKIGLMYASDFGFAVEPSAWTTTLFNYDSISITNKSWMYMGLYEWPIVRRSDNSGGAFYVHNDGHVGSADVNLYHAVRPVLYLESETAYAGGSGTASSPILIK